MDAFASFFDSQSSSRNRWTYDSLKNFRQISPLVQTHLKQIGELAGLAVGATVLLNVMFAGPTSGASMNPARSLGPAIVSHKYEGIWVCIEAPVLGAHGGAWVYNMIRYTDKPLHEITKSASFLKSSERT